MNKIITLAILICISFSLVAKSSYSRTGSLLWKVSGLDITEPSYILGTHHLTDKEFVHQITGFQDAFDNSKTIIGELKLQDKASMQEEMASMMMIDPTEKGFKELLSPEEYQQLDTDLISLLGGGLDAMGAFKPNIIGTFVAIKLYAIVYPEFDPIKHQAIDEYLQIIGAEKGKSVEGLETLKDQIDALFGESIEEQIKSLICSISDIDGSLEDLKELDEYYLSGNLEAMYNLAYADDARCPSSEKEKTAILKDRNDKWLQKLPQFFTSGSNFIAVGALHLAGDEGLLNQLSQMGYTVEAVK